MHICLARPCVHLVLVRIRSDYFAGDYLTATITFLFRLSPSISSWYARGWSIASLPLRRAVSMMNCNASEMMFGRMGTTNDSKCNHLIKSISASERRAATVMGNATRMFCHVIITPLLDFHLPLQKPQPSMFSFHQRSRPFHDYISHRHFRSNVRPRSRQPWSWTRWR